MTHSINDGQIGPEIIGKRQSRKAFVREVEIDVVLDLSQAIAVRDWLNDKISQVEKLAQQSMVPKILARLPIVNKSNRKINERSGKNVVRRNINK